MTLENVVRNEDVLCGRGGATNNHVGNRCFRQLVACNQSHYLLAKKRDKKLIARSIVDNIRKRGGRFLKREVKSGSDHWVDVGDKKASEKTSQALREGLDVRASKKSLDQGLNATQLLQCNNNTEELFLKKSKDKTAIPANKPDETPKRPLALHSTDNISKRTKVDEEMKSTDNVCGTESNQVPCNLIPSTISNELGTLTVLPEPKKKESVNFLQDCLPSVEAKVDVTKATLKIVPV